MSTKDTQDNQGSRVVTQPHRVPVMSFVTVTFIIESLSLADAVIKTTKKLNTTTPAKAD